MPVKRSIRVAVIGGGYAGLAAAVTPPSRTFLSPYSRARTFGGGRGGWSTVASPWITACTC